MSWLKLVVFVVLSSTFVACGSSKDEKAQDRAESSVDQYNALIADLNSSALPSESWTEDQLVKYESKLSRLELLEASLDKANGKNGITIIGGDNKKFIAQRRALISEIRFAKTQAGKKQKEKEKTSQTDSQKLIELKVLSKELGFLGNELLVIGPLTSTSPMKDMLAVEDKNSQMIVIADKMIILLNSLPYSSETFELTNTLNALKKNAKRDLERAQKLILESKSKP